MIKSPSGITPFDNRLSRLRYDSWLVNSSAARFTNSRTTEAALHAAKGGVRSVNKEAPVRSSDAMNSAEMKLEKLLPLLLLISTTSSPQPKQLFSWLLRMPLQDKHRVIHRLKRVTL